MNTTADPAAEVVYPDSDGRPMADNTLQFEWITTIKWNLDIHYRDDPNVFVAGDHLIYPVEGDNTIRKAPDVYVAFGRPKGHRGSYQVWREAGVFPQVVIEVLSPKNTVQEMAGRRKFYARYGAEEFYVYDPLAPLLDVWERAEGQLRPVAYANVFVSPRLGVRFDMSGPELALYGPDGRRFLPPVGLGTARLEAERRADRERRRADRERRRADRAEQAAEVARLQADLLRARLRELGIDPDAG